MDLMRNVIRIEGMDIHRLITMANETGSFFEALSDRPQASDEIARHLKRFWDPGMRQALLQYVDSQGGGELKGIVLEAVLSHRTLLL
jgi:formate dehydrogenase subunit delta